MSGKTFQSKNERTEMVAVCYLLTQVNQQLPFVLQISVSIAALHRVDPRQPGLLLANTHKVTVGTQIPHDVLNTVPWCSKKL